MRRMVMLVALAAGLSAGAAWAAPPVAVSIEPQAYFAQRVAGPEAPVQVMIPPGASPHSHQPTVRQMADLARAKLFFSIGVPYEEVFLPKLQANLPGLTVVDTRQGVELLAMTEPHHHDGDEAEEGEHHEGEEGEEGHHHDGEAEEADHHHEGLDPHVWLDPNRVKILATNMARAYAQADPGHQGLYQANLAAFLSDLDSLDAKLRQALAPLKGKTMLVYHPAFGYFAQAYGLKQEAIETGGKQPSPRQTARLIQEAKDDGVRVIFVQPEFDRSTAQAIAQAINGAVVPLDPLARDYLANLERMAQEVAAALR